MNPVQMQYATAVVDHETAHRQRPTESVATHSEHPDLRDVPRGLACLWS